MDGLSSPSVAIIDFGMGNLFSVAQAARAVGLDCAITADPRFVREASGIILPGVGAFPVAMRTLSQLGLTELIRAKAADGTPMMGICLGFQLMASESSEFGTTPGLGLLPGIVRQLPNTGRHGGRVPNVGWRAVWPTARKRCWEGTWLQRMDPGTFMYFVHSFHFVPAHDGVATATTIHGDEHICAAVQLDNLFGCQFHPERSDKLGLTIYEQFAAATRTAAATVG